MLLSKMLEKIQIIGFNIKVVLVNTEAQYKGGWNKTKNKNKQKNKEKQYIF